MPRVVIALSGGVDSAVSALLLKKQGYEVFAVHMQNWDHEINEEGTIREGEGCKGKEDLNHVKAICALLDISLYTYNFVPEYWETVFDVYVRSLESNLNTNPDIDCNAHIKFGVLLDSIEKDFGKDIKLATGHWAKVIEKDGKHYLATCANEWKDQTYFLSSLNEYQLSKAIFPLEDISSKEEVRRIAKENGIPIWDKKDSVGICFIGKRNYRDFIGQYIPEKEGDMVDIDTGEVLGKHKGTHFYVLHQSTGLFLKGYEEKYYVCSKVPETNTVYLCRKSQLEKYLHKTTTVCRSLHWIHESPIEGSYVYIKPRHSSKFLKVKILSIDSNECILSHEKTYITSPGQAIVFYDLDRKICLGNSIYSGDNDSQYIKK